MKNAVSFIFISAPFSDRHLNHSSNRVGTFSSELSSLAWFVGVVEKKNMRVLLFTALLAAFLIQNASAWGASGHSIIAQLGDNMLTDEARKMVQQQLEGDQTMESISSWPDQYCHTPEGSWSSCLHFINVQQQEKLYKFENDCIAVNNVSDCCVAASILNFTQQISDQYHQQGKQDQDQEHWSDSLQVIQNYLKRDTLEGEPTPLSYVIHFIGDIHQPLHCGYDCDAGGNLVQVLFFGERVNLHAVWDDGMIDKYCNGDWPSFAQELQDYIDTHPKIYHAYNTVLNNTLWAEESYNDYTRHKVYDFSEKGEHRNSGDPVLYPFSTCPYWNLVQLPNNYYYRNIEVVKKRLLAGGIRLAATLNAVAAGGDMGGK